MKTTSILIADDHTLVRETWSFILNSHADFSVVAEAGSAEQAIEQARSLRPDAVLLDINLPGISGIEAATQLRKYSPASRIIGVSMHTQPAYARRMMQAGAMGYVTKNSGRGELFEAISEVMQGRKYICQEIKNILSEQMFFGADLGKESINNLSLREIEIIRRIKKGESSKEIAAALCIAVKTVEVHRYNILRKLKLKNAAALVNFIHNSELGMAV